MKFEFVYNLLKFFDYWCFVWDYIDCYGSDVGYVGLIVSNCVCKVILFCKFYIWLIVYFWIRDKVWDYYFVMFRFINDCECC